jgi:hypothetical protein
MFEKIVDRINRMDMIIGKIKWKKKRHNPVDHVCKQKRKVL